MTLSLVSNATANGTYGTTYINAPLSGQDKFSVYVFGTWGTADVSLYATPNGTDYVPIADAGWDASSYLGVVNLKVNAIGIQALVANANASTNISVVIL